MMIILGVRRIHACLQISNAQSFFFLVWKKSQNGKWPMDGPGILDGLP